MLKKIAYNCIQEVSHPNRAFTDCPSWYKPDTFREEARKRVQETKNDVDLIFDELLDLFRSPGVALIDIMIDDTSESGEFSSLTSDDLGVMRVQEGMHLDILYSLNVLDEFYINFSKPPLDITIVYACLTSLGVEFLKKCDYDLVQTLRAREITVQEDSQKQS